MSIIQIVFSPTGGTQKVADIITSEWNEPVRKIDLSDPDTDFSSICLDKEDVAVIAVPSFGGRVPEPAVKRLEEIRGNEASVYMATGHMRTPSLNSVMRPGRAASV